MFLLALRRALWIFNRLIKMKETLNCLLQASQKEYGYETPEVTVVTICPEGLLCQSGGIFGAEHGGFVGDDENPEDLW